MSTRPPSLRQRRKSETWAAIHEAAANLVRARGVDQTTVEAIAEAAGVSPRTFFNYFPTKDDAVLGMRAPVLDPALLEKFSLENDVLGQVSQLLLEVLRSAFGSPDAVRRRELMRQDPHLKQRHRELTAEAEDLVRHALADVLRQHPDWSAGVGQHGVEDVARMLVLLAGVPLRAAISSPDHDAAAGLTPDMLTSSLSLLHQIQRKLS